MATADIAAGTMLGGYRVERALGHGGMGVVYLARQISLDRLVALKVLMPELASDEAFRRRFLTESHVAASIDHPNVIPVHEAAEQDGRLFVTMRYVDGPDLGALLRAERRLTPPRAARIVAQVGAALDAAHRAGLVHRDVKPGNVLVSDPGGDDHCYLTDFGLVKRSASASGLTQTGQVLGTVSYIAPEQLRGATVDGRADVYALGCVLFEILTGRRPFERDTDVATLWAHLSEEPPAPSHIVPSIPPALDTVVRRALAKDPDERWPTAGELGRAALAAAGAEEADASTVVDPPPPAPPPATATPRRRARLLAAGALVATAVAAAAAALLTDGDGREPATQPALRVTAEVPVGGSPVTTSAAGERVWVTFESDGRLGVVDFATRAVTQSRRYGASLAVTAVRDDRLVVGDFGENVEDGKGWVVVVDADSGRVVQRVRTAEPYELDVSEDSVWLVDANRLVQGIDLERGEVIAEHRVEQPFDVAIVDGTAWVLSYPRGELVPFDAGTGSSAGRAIDVGARPLSLAVAAGAIWVVTEPGQLVRVNPAGGRPSTVAIGPADPQRLIAGDDEALWVKDRRGVTVIDPSAPSRKDTLRLTGVLEDVTAADGAAYVTRETADQTSSVVQVRPAG